MLTVYLRSSKNVIVKFVKPSKGPCDFLKTKNFAAYATDLADFFEIHRIYKMTLVVVHCTSKS